MGDRLRVDIRSQYVTSQLGDSALHPSLNRVPAAAGVRAGISPLPGGRQHCVIPYGTRVPVAVRLVANCYTLFTFTFDNHSRTSCAKTA